MLILTVIAVAIFSLALYDLTQRKHAILRNFPIIGHLRYLLESVGPELRQYIVTSNQEERPFSRDQRRWVYASSKLQNNYFGFGTDAELENSPNHIVIKHAAFPIRAPYPGEPGYDPTYPLACAKVLGEFRQRRKAFRPPSVVNVSGMSFGSLSGAAVEALNRGAALAGCLQNTGEGGLSPHHLHGGDLVLQIGTGYFGCRELDGRFSLTRLLELTDKHPSIRAIEIKLSQGAKPGIGGVLPRAKVTPEIAGIRGVPLGKDCISPAAHTAFRDPDSLLDFVESVAAATGLPVGIKSAVGEIAFWRELARLMDTSGRGVDFVTIDGGEGGTGAAPLVFRDHVGAAVQDRVQPCPARVRRSPPPRSPRVHRLGQAGIPGRGRSSLLRSAATCERRPRGDALDRLHPGAAVPHRPLPDRHHDAEPVAHARAGTGAEIGSTGQLRALAPKGAACRSRAHAASRIRRWWQPIASRSSTTGSAHKPWNSCWEGAAAARKRATSTATALRIRLTEPVAPLVFRRNPRPTPVVFPPQR